MVNSCLQRVICQKNLEGKKGVSFSCTTVFQILLSSNSIRDTFTHSVFSDDADGSPHFLHTTFTVKFAKKFSHLMDTLIGSRVHASYPTTNCFYVLSLTRYLCILF
eukprot:PhF_6_TR10356/c0_g1_i2/m.16029